MNMQLSKTPIGLDGVPAAETVLSHVDGERGELIIAGERVGDLARRTGFEGVTARLWSGGTGQPVGEAAVRALSKPSFARHPNRPIPQAAEALLLMSYDRRFALTWLCGAYTRRALNDRR